jgi:hypothetical protein
MTHFTIRAGNGVTRVAVVAAAGAAAVALACPASADETLMGEKAIAIENCSAIGSGQFCPTTANLRDNSASRLQFTTPAGSRSVKVEFTANRNHCSDMIAHVFFDGREWGSHIVHPGQTDGGGYEIPVDYGLHQVQVQAEGLSGGCNTGFVSAWGGVLRIYQLT